ncbi:MAG: ribonuclease M5 [Acholeplasmataceae bacterium]|jgi:ribonuclease M5
MKKIYVVEGIRDEEILKRIDPNIITIRTNGFSFDEELVNKLTELEKDYQIILILDPDFPGKKIRDKISEKLLNPYHIYLPKDKAISKDKQKVGLEHVDLDILKELLDKEICFDKYPKGTLKSSDFIKLNLTGHKNAQKNRLKISEYFHLPKCNAKRLLVYLNQLGINYEKIKGVLNES